MNTAAANSTFGMAVPRATPARPNGRTKTMLSTRLSTPATRKPTVGRPALPSPISIGRATPRTGRKTMYDSMRICRTCPAGCSKLGSTHHAMNRGPSTMRNRPAASVRERAIFDHLRKISRSSSCLPWVCSRVAAGITTAAIDSRKSRSEQAGGEREGEGDLRPLEEDLAQLVLLALGLQPRRGRHHDRRDRQQEIHEVDDEAVRDGEVRNRADVHVGSDHD